MYKFRLRTEKSLSYTNFFIEDVIFIDRKRVVSLEYIFYQKDSKYYKVSPVPKNDPKASDYLIPGTPDYVDKIDPLSAFKTAPDHFMIGGHYIAKNSIQDSKYPLMDYKGVNVEAILSMWKIDRNGQICKDFESRIGYGAKFLPTVKFNMRLTLSHSTKLVTLLVPDDGSKDKVKLMAWRAKNLKPEPVSDSLQQSLNQLPVGDIQCARFVSEDRYLHLTLARHRGHHPKIHYVHDFIFEASNGTKVFDFSNLHKGLRVSKHEEAEQNEQIEDEEWWNQNQYEGVAKDSLKNSMRCLSFLVVHRASKEFKKAEDDEDKNEDYDQESYNDEEASEGKDEEDKEGEEEKEEEQQAEEGAEEGGEEGGEDGAEYEGGEEAKESLSFGFFFGWDSLKENKIFPMVMVELTLQQIQEASVNGKKDQLEFIRKKAEEKLNEYELNANWCFSVPRSWIGLDKMKEENWEHSVQIFSQKYFDEFGFINHALHDFRAFRGPAYYTANTEFFHQLLPELGHTEMVRNPQSKDYLFLIIKEQGEGSQVSCCFYPDKKHTLKLSNEDTNSSPDVIVQFSSKLKNVDDVEDFETYCSFSSVTLSEDKEIIMKQLKFKGKKRMETSRKSISVRHSGSYPIFFYNLGQNKIVVQSIIDPDKQLITSLPSYQKFMSFIEFNKLEDIGFYGGGLGIELCSRVAFLTLNKKVDMYQMNLLLVDPYCNPIKIGYFKSTLFFDHDYYNKSLNDIIIKTIGYNTKKTKSDTDFKFKMFFQFSDGIQQLEAETVIEDDYSEDEDDDDYDSEEEEEVDDEEQNVKVNQERVQAILSDRGYIYYVLSADGQCIIKQINPKVDDEHLTVYEIKAKKCLGFSTFGLTYFFLNEEKNILKLEQDLETQMLIEQMELFLKPKDKPNFQAYPFSNMIISESYILNDSFIFYLQKDQPLINGILDMEVLTEQFAVADGHEVEHDKGPFLLNGSSLFVTIHKIDAEAKFVQRVCLLPDSSSITLVSDFGGNISFSTFLNEDRILLQSGYRFLIFDSMGLFIDEVEFVGMKGQNRLKIACLSDTNRFFLFGDEENHQLVVCRMVQTMKDEREQYEFSFMFEIPKIEQFSFGELMDKIFSSEIKFSFDEGGSIVCTYLKSSFESSSDYEINCIKYTYGDQIYNFKHQISFPYELVKDVQTFVSDETNRLKHLLKLEKQNQNRLPPNFRNSQKQQELKRELADIKRRGEAIAAPHHLGTMFIVNCSHAIKYIMLDATTISSLTNLSDYVVFKDCNMYFDKGVEICKILSTCIPHQALIVAKDSQKKIIILVTWDFKNNMEVSMLQYNYGEGARPENYVTRGLKNKMGYFVDEVYIQDLEFNLPIELAFGNTMRGEGIQKHLSEQRKIYKDNSRWLSIDQPNVLNLSDYRWSLLFWQNINQLGEKEDILKNNASLSQFNQFFNGSSMFHYFATKPEVIAIIHSRLKQLHQNNSMTPEEANMSLLILTPDEKGDNALDLAIKGNTPKSLDLMIDMLSWTKNGTITRMMLKCFPKLMFIQSEIFQQFLNNITFKPALMEKANIIPWPEDLQEFIFASHTSIISDEVLLEALYGNKIPDIVDKKPEIQDNSNDSDLLMLKEKGLNTFQLKIHNEQLSNVLRVQAEALDCDWLFQGDNAKNMIHLLAESATGQTLSQKSIKVFIELMWGAYQPAIIKFVFIPYFIYFACIVYLGSAFAGDFLDQLDETQKLNKTVNMTQFWILQAVGCCGLLYFSSIELTSIWKQGLGYFNDIWNYMDTLLMLLNALQLFLLMACGATNTLIVDAATIRNVASLCCFLMWVKMFYWMRLFKNTAHFITLIFRTIYDIRIFALMLLIILAAFANFFFIINNNTPSNPNHVKKEKEEDFHYVNDYVGQPFFNSLISMYLLGLGEFDLDGYSKGPDVYFAWGFFILGTFLVLVVFMNMLIAIMGDTFSRVQERAEQNSLREQLELIEDNCWLLNLRNHFKGKKYIIRLYTLAQLESEEPDITQKLNEIERDLKNQTVEVKDVTLRRMDLLEKQLKQQQRIQNGKMQEMSEMLKKIKEVIDKQQEKKKEETVPAEQE